MTHRALVIRTYGDLELARPIANNLESPELRRLRAKVGVNAPVRNAHYARMIMEAKKKYAVRPISPARERMWGVIGLMVLLAANTRSQKCSGRNII